MRQMEPRMAFSTQDVSKLAGASLRQLQWWDEQGVVSPVHHGHRRLYSRLEVVQVSLIVDLRRKGLSLKKARGVMEEFMRLDGSQHVQNHDLGSSLLYLVTDGTQVTLTGSATEFAEAALNSPRAVICLSVSRLIQRTYRGETKMKPVRIEADLAGSPTGRQREPKTAATG